MVMVMAVVMAAMTGITMVNVIVMLTVIIAVRVIMMTYHQYVGTLCIHGLRLPCLLSSRGRELGSESQGLF